MQKGRDDNKKTGQKRGRSASLRFRPCAILTPSDNYFLTGAIVSFAVFATRNLTTVFALILIVSPV